MAVDYVKEGRIAVFTINRPEAMNALNEDVIRGLNEAMIDFRDDPDLWVGIVTGAGDRAFSAGADIKGFRPGPMAGPEGITTISRADQIWKPFIAAINGYCLGGGLELALTCDLRIAVEHARLGLPEIRVGVIPAGGGISRLPRFVPRAVASEILLMGRQIDAQEAFRIGLINKVVRPDQLMPVAREWAETICQAGPLQVRAVKEAMLRGYNIPQEESLRIEKDLLNRVRQTEDYTEGARAFVEKRKPNWQGK